MENYEPMIVLMALVVIVSDHTYEGYRSIRVAMQHLRIRCFIRTVLLLVIACSHIVIVAMHVHEMQNVPMKMRQDVPKYFQPQSTAS